MKQKAPLTQLLPEGERSQTPSPAQGEGRGEGKLPLHRLPPVLLQRARELRQPQTPAEQAVWRYLRSRQADGYKFRRQHPIGSFIVDFYCPAVQLVVEIDGDSHADQVEYDQARTEWLESQGCRVIRFSNREVYTNVCAVIENILEHCKANG